MSDIARFNIILSLALVAIGVSIYQGLVPPVFPVAAPVASPFCSTQSSPPELLAKAAYAYDIATNRPLVDMNAEAQLPLASLTKMMTVLVSLDSLSQTDDVIISKEALTPDGDSGFKAGDTWTAGDLMSFSLITSSNDGVHALALGAADKTGSSLDSFISHMNEKATSIGMTQTYFLNDTGLDVSKNAPGALGSARDVAILLTYILKTHADDFSSSGEKQEVFNAGGKTFTAHNTNSLANSIPEVIISKTGFTDLAGGNLAVLFEPLPGRPVAAVVLGSTRETREADMLKLTEFARQAIKKSILCEHNGN